jgi:hypothetical protein
MRVALAGARQWTARFLAPCEYEGLRGSWRGNSLVGLTVGVVVLPVALVMVIATGPGQPPAS